MSDKDAGQVAMIYFQNNRQRMDYPTYRANGYQKLLVVYTSQEEP